MTFSLQLSEEQSDLRDWVHGFARDVVRPAASEWDEREETPWPLIQEAAKIGLYSFDFLANAYTDPTGLSGCIVSEELFWGDAGIGMSIMGTSLAVAAIFGTGTPEQLVEWMPQCFGDATQPYVAAFCSTEPESGSDVAAMRTRARYDEATDEWVLNGQKAFATNGGIANVHVVTASIECWRTCCSKVRARPRLIAATSATSSTGFSMKSSAPALMPSTAIGTSAWPEMSTTGMFAPRLDSSRTSSMPSMPGIRTSATTQPARARSNAARKLAAES